MTQENHKINTCLNCGGPAGKDFAFCTKTCRKEYQDRKEYRERRKGRKGAKTLTAKGDLKEADDKIYTATQKLEDAFGWLEEPGPKEFGDIRKELKSVLDDLGFIQEMINKLGKELDQKEQEE